MYKAFFFNDTVYAYAIYSHEWYAHQFVKIAC